MNIRIANYEPGRIGGGWTQARYLADGLGHTPYEETDIYFITGPTMANHDQVNQAKADGKKIVLRVDNAVRNSRNRGTGMTRLKAFAEQADLVIYQSEWARNFLFPYLHIDGPAILNGVDLNRFNSDSRRPEDDSYLYVRSSRDEGKQWIMAWYYFVNKLGKLNIVGKFSQDNMDWNFDFYNDERFTFWGEQTNMADMYNQNKYFLYTYLNDACSNTAIEALASGCEIIDVYGMAQTGGMPEIMAAWNKDPKLLSLETMINNYKEAINAIR